jgi:two-component system, NtrC family, response regulator AtoC
MSERTGVVLVVDDDVAVGTVLAGLLAQAGMKASHVTSGAAALTVLAESPADVVVTDLRMPVMDGMQLLAAIVSRWPGRPVIVLTAHGTVPLAVEAMRAGAADFVLKPFDREEIVFVVRKALHLARHADAQVAAAPASAGSFISQSPVMRDVLDLLARAAKSAATVLLRGQSGTGKELAARAIHEQSPRRKGPFVAVNCAALPDELLESELFGYEKGAFTGATCRKPGRIELANGGTLFLDEIGDLALTTQVKLLRVLQERTFERLGGTESIKVDARFVAATHQDLDAMVRAKTFREDLFYRLNVIPIAMPPLAARPEDIESLALHFLATFGAANEKPGIAIDPVAIERLKREPWPGNVRQLQNFVERLVVLADGAVIGGPDVARELARGSPVASQSSPPAAPEGGRATLDERRRETERQALREALDRVHGNRTLAARILGVSRRTLYNMLETHGLG